MMKACVLPFVLYLLGTTLIASYAGAWYPWAYAAVVAIVALSIGYTLRSTGLIRPHARVLKGVLFGVVGIVLWITLSHLRVEQYVSQWLPSWLQPSERVSYNPFDELTGVAIWLFISVRLIGLAIIVPLVEEVFWRGFLLRWMIDPDWEEVPIGKYTWASCFSVVGLFAIAHPELLAAAVYCLLLNGLLYWTKDLWQCVIAHATSNLLLGVYVLSFGKWWLW